MQSIDGRKLLLDAAIRQIVMDSHEHHSQAAALGELMEFWTTKGIGSIRNYNCKCTLVHLKNGIAPQFSSTEFQISGAFVDCAYCDGIVNFNL
jgi:hypothetical protein